MGRPAIASLALLIDTVQLIAYPWLAARRAPSVALQASYMAVQARVVLTQKLGRTVPQTLSAADLDGFDHQQQRSKDQVGAQRDHAESGAW
jgi:hypothetical protein